MKGPHEDPSRWWESQSNSERLLNEEENERQIDGERLGELVGGPRVVLEIVRTACDGTRGGMAYQLLLQVGEQEPALAKLLKSWSISTRVLKSWSIDCAEQQSSEQVLLEERQVLQLVALCEGTLAAAQGDGDRHAWLRALTGVKVVPLKSLLDCRAAEGSAQLVAENLWESLGDRYDEESSSSCSETMSKIGEGAAGSSAGMRDCTMPLAWNRFVYVLGSCECYELETALLKCVDDRMPVILRNVPEVQDHASSCGRQMLLHHDGQYFEVYPKAAAATENGLGERPMDDLKIARAARVIQRSWRSNRTQACEKVSGKPAEEMGHHGPSLGGAGASPELLAKQRDEEAGGASPGSCLKSESELGHHGPSGSQLDNPAQSQSMLSSAANADSKFSHQDDQWTVLKSCDLMSDASGLENFNGAGLGQAGESSAAETTAAAAATSFATATNAVAGTGTLTDAAATVAAATVAAAGTGGETAAAGAGAAAEAAEAAGAAAALPLQSPATETTGDKSEAQVWFEGRGLAKYWGKLEAEGYDDLRVLREADAREIDVLVDETCKMLRGHAGHFKRGLALIPAGPDPSELLRRIATDGLEGVGAIEAWLRGRGPAFAKYGEVMVELGYDDLQILQELDEDEVAGLIKDCGMPKGHALHFRRGLPHVRR